MQATMFAETSSALQQRNSSVPQAGIDYSTLTPIVLRRSLI